MSVPMHYKCQWCGFEFDRMITTAGQGHGKVSDQVQCIQCRGFQKTWPEAKK